MKDELIKRAWHLVEVHENYLEKLETEDLKPADLMDMFDMLKDLSKAIKNLSKAESLK
jgi:hypothetical protein